MSSGGQQVFEFRARRASYDEALDAYSRAEFRSCVQLLSGLTDLASLVLLARALSKVGEIGKAVDCLRGCENFAEIPMPLRAEFLVVRASLNTVSGGLDEARADLDSARPYAFSSADDSIEAEYQYCEALFAFAERDYEGAREAALAVLEIRASMSSAQRHRSASELNLSKARAQHVLGLLWAVLERYEEQRNCIRLAIEDYKRSSRPDAWLEAFLYESLAFLVRDFYLPGDAEILMAAIRDERWPSELASARYEIRRALGWHAALGGDHLGAFREFRFAADAAPTVPLKILACTDRAFLSRELSENENASEEISYAADLAEKVDWKTLGSERLILMPLVQELAPVMPALADAIYEKYRAIRLKISPVVLNSVDRRPRAYELMAEGALARARGSNGRAAQIYTEAFEIWSHLGYNWRAATAAVQLAELDAGIRYDEFARCEASKNPNSWLARRVARLAPKKGSVTPLIRDFKKGQAQLNF